MRDARDYLEHVHTLILINSQLVHWAVVREETQGDAGLFRYRLTLRGGDLLEAFELFRIVGDAVQVTQYSFHWQTAEGHLRKRWDNAPHHPEVSTGPHHLHVGCASRVEPHRPITFEGVLAILAAEA